MQLEIAAHAGFCMGVRRAVQAAWDVAEQGTPACTLGELIHNPQVVRELREKGIPAVTDPQAAAGRLVLIRSHGVAPDVCGSAAPHCGLVLRRRSTCYSCWRTGSSGSSGNCRMGTGTGLCGGNP